MTDFPERNPIVRLAGQVRRLIYEINEPGMPNAPTARLEDLHRQMKDSRRSEWWSSLPRSLRRDHYGALASLLAWYAPLKSREVMEQVQELEQKKAHASETISKLTFSQNAIKTYLEAEVHKCIHNTNLCIMILNRAETDAARAARIFDDYRLGQTWPPREEWDEDLPPSDTQYGVAIRDTY